MTDEIPMIQVLDDISECLTLQEARALQKTLPSRWHAEAEEVIQESTYFREVARAMVKKRAM